MDVLERNRCEYELRKHMEHCINQANRFINNGNIEIANLYINLGNKINSVSPSVAMVHMFDKVVSSLDFVVEIN